MPNGILEEVLDILREEKAIPESVSSRIILAAQIQLFKKLDSLDERVKKLENFQRPVYYLWARIGVPALVSGVTLLLAWLFGIITP